jgi:hypothetical protein
MRDVRTKIRNGGDSESNFLKSDFLKNNLQFLVFNLQVFSENRAYPNQFIEITCKEIKIYSRDVRTKIENGADSEFFVLKSDLL